MATLDELVVRIKADTSQLDRELKRLGGTVQQSAGKMQSSVNGLAASFRGLIPALSVAAVASFAKSAIDAAGKMTDLAAQIGFSASTLSALEEGLSATGSSLEQFAAAVNLMNANIGQAASGNQEMIKNFDALGLSVRGLQQMSPQEQFYAISKALAGVGEQFRQTDLGRSIFGRGFASLLPMIKETNGEFGALIDRQQALGKALNDDQLGRLDELGDALGRVSLKIRNDLLVAINDAIGGLLRLFNVGDEASSEQMERQIAALRGKLAVPENLRARNRLGQVVDSDAAVNQQIARLRGLQEVEQSLAASRANKAGTASGKPDGKGSNAGLIKAAGGKSEAARQAEDYDEAGDALEEYMRKQEEEISLLRLDERTRAGTKAVYEAQNLAIKEGTLLTSEQIATVRALAETQYDLQKTLDETGDRAVVNARLVKDSFADALESALFDFESFGDGVAGVLDGIARNIARQKIIDPLSGQLGGLLSGAFSGGTTLYQGFGADAASRTVGGLGDLFGSLLGFADGGSPPVGKPSIVGERGPEIFVPKTAGTVYPNGTTPGGGVTVVNNWNISPGVQGTVEAELRRAAPAIVNQSVSATMQAIERGGRAAQIVGRRS